MGTKNSGSIVALENPLMIQE